MSGRRGEFAADCAAPEEQMQLHLAHLVAKQVCSQNGLGAIQSHDGLDVEKCVLWPWLFSQTCNPPIKGRDNFAETNQSFSNRN